jgi:hypothetical protein
MDYIAWNNALAAHFFTESRRKTPVYLLVTDGLLAKLFSQSLPEETLSSDEVVSNFVRAVIDGPTHMTYQQHTENLCERARKAHSTQDDWILIHNHGTPLYIGYLALFVLTWTRDLDGVTEATFYPKLNQLLSEHGYDLAVRGEISTPQLEKTHELWVDLQNWANDINAGQRGLFFAYCEGKHKKYVGMSKAHALLNSRDLTYVLPRIFGQSGFGPRGTADREEMANCLSRLAHECGLSKRGWYLLNHHDQTLRRAVLDIALYELSSWDGVVPDSPEPSEGIGHEAPRGQASWKIYQNGREHRLDLYCENISTENGGHATVVCKSGNGKSVRKAVYADGSAFFTTEELADAGFDFGGPLTVEVDSQPVSELPPLAAVVGGPLFFRWPSHTRPGWLAPLRLGDGVHFTASSIGVLFPIGTTSLPHATLGATQLDPKQASVVLVRRNKQRALLARYRFPAIAKPQPFKLDSHEYFVVGPQPYLEVSDPADITNVPDERVVVVVGLTAQIVLQNAGAGPHSFVSDRGEWNADGARTTTLRIAETDYGHPISVAAGGHKLKVVFVPANPTEKLPPGWSWAFARDSSVVHRHYERGERIGEYTGPDGTSVRCAYATPEPLWWWAEDSEGKPRELGPQLGDVAVVKSMRDTHRFRLKVWNPTPLSLCVNDEVAYEVPPKELWSISLHELLIGRQDFRNGVGEGHEDIVRLGDATVARVTRIPDRPVLTLLDGRPYVFAAANTQNYSLVWIRESDLLSGTVSAEPLCNVVFAEGQLSLVEPPVTSLEREGVWLGLVAQAAPPQQLMEYLWLDSPIDFVTVQRPSPGLTLTERLEVDSETTIAQARTYLAAFKALPARARQLSPVFDDAISDLCTFDCTSDRTFWDNEFRRRCVGPNGPPPDQTDLEVVLGQMLSAGFNWIAEPKWISSRLSEVRDQYRRQRRQFNPTQKNLVRRACPLILCHQSISEGYPWVELADNTACELDQYLRFLNTIGEGQGDGNRLAVRAPSVNVAAAARNRRLATAGVPLRGFSARGVRLSNPPFPQPIPVTIDGRTKYLDYQNGLHRFSVFVDNEHAVAKYLTDETECEGDFGEIYPSDLNDLFTAGLGAAEAVLGAKRDRGLALMFSAVNDRLAAQAIASASQRNRHVIFQAVLLSRLHERHCEAWPDWPLRDQAAYRLVCTVLSQAWAVPARRHMLFQDLIPIEWFLTWFSV